MEVIGNAGARHTKEYKRAGQVKKQPTLTLDLKKDVSDIKATLLKIQQENAQTNREIASLRAEVNHLKQFRNYTDKQLLTLYKEFDERLNSLSSQIADKKYEQKWSK